MTTSTTTTDRKKSKRRYGPPPPPDDPWTPPQGDMVPVPPRTKDKEARGPPDMPLLPGSRVPYGMIERQCFTIREFCASHRLSLRLYYKLAKEGKAPKTFTAGSRILISIESAKAWRAEREAANKKTTST